MQPITFEPQITKGNSKGTGWITTPARVRSTLTIGEWYELALVTKEQDSLSLHVKLVKNKTSWGFYLPQILCSEKQLLGQQVKVELRHTDYSPITFSETNRVRIPNSIVERHNIQKDDLYKVEIKTGQQEFQELVLINAIDRSNKINRADEHYFLIRFHELQGATTGAMKILSKEEKVPLQINEDLKEMIYLPSLFPDAVLGKIDANKMIIFAGNHRPIITPITVNIADIVHYFGCYYADGTKSGSWSINASTPEQEGYYIFIYKLLILNPELNFDLTYTRKPSENRPLDIIKSDLYKYWNQNYKTNLLMERIHIINTDSEEKRNWNEFGSLRIRDNRELVQILHLSVMKKIIDVLQLYILKEYMWKFLFGILEGDGYVSGGEERFGIGFSCHISDQVIREFLILLDIQYSEDLYKINNRISSGIEIRFGLFEILQNFEIISKNIFQYYPKRRKLFIKRLRKQSTVQYILSEKSTASTFVVSFVSKHNLKNDSIIKLLNELFQENNFINEKEDI